MLPIDILVTLDHKYLPPLRVTLKSMFANDPRASFHIYMVYDGIPADEIVHLSEFCARNGSELYPIPVEASLFQRAPVSGYLTKAMYYRLLACKILPKTLDKVLYLDPDTLVINPVQGLYDTDLTGYLFAGAMLTGFTDIKKRVNRIRLGTYGAEGYFNSGVLLMNLKLQRAVIHERDIFDYIDEHRRSLILPDQDVLNGLYGERILPLDDSLYNYYAYRYETYRMVSGGKKDLDWVMANTVILHFCGKVKPWMTSYRSKFAALYKHYAALTARDLGEIEGLCEAPHSLSAPSASGFIPAPARQAGEEA